MTSSSSPANVPGADPNGTALVPIERVEDVDEETALQLVRSMRRVGVGIGISGVAPIVGALFLLQAAPFEIPIAAAVAAFGVALVSPFFILYGQRRAFLEECASLGISRELGKKLYRRYVRGELRLDLRTPLKRITLDDLDRIVVRRLLKP